RHTCHDVYGATAVRALPPFPTRRSSDLALMGENGAGKSTLMKILGGAYPPDEGELLIDGQPVVLKGIADAKKRGIALIHQELMLDRKSTRLNSSHVAISYAVFCLKKKTK